MNLSIDGLYEQSIKLLDYFICQIRYILLKYIQYKDKKGKVCQVQYIKRVTKG